MNLLSFHSVAFYMTYISHEPPYLKKYLNNIFDDQKLRLFDVVFIKLAAGRQPEVRCRGDVTHLYRYITSSNDAFLTSNYFKMLDKCHISLTFIVAVLFVYFKMAELRFCFLRDVTPNFCHRQFSYSYYSKSNCQLLQHI